MLFRSTLLATVGLEVSPIQSGPLSLLMFGLSDTVISGMYARARDCTLEDAARLLALVRAGNRLDLPVVLCAPDDLAAELTDPS